jgi:hypothetical protein
MGFLVYLLRILSCCSTQPSLIGREKARREGLEVLGLELLGALGDSEEEEEEEEEERARGVPVVAMLVPSRFQDLRRQRVAVLRLEAWE